MAEEERRGVGLRIDVDTFRGTRDGVPQLLQVLARYGIRATFFFTVGPDNMGRHLWRLLKPAFLAKMLRSNAPALYGWDIVLRGTLWPGPPIAERLAHVIRATSSAGHEVGLHAWDHHRWQARSESMQPQEIHDDLRLGMDALTAILGTPVRSSACAGWQCNDAVLRAKESFGFTYNSDCRGTSIFTPILAGVRGAPQIPVTLPTYDEVIGRNGISDENYNEYLLSLIRPQRLNVLTVHAEVEGISRKGLFREFLDMASELQVRFVPLVELLGSPSDIPAGRITPGYVAGREGRVCHQAADAAA